LEDFDSHLGGSGTIFVPSPSIQLGIGNAPLQDLNVHSTQDVEMIPVDPGPFDQNEAQAMDVPEYGWCRIVEEPQDD